MSISIPPEAFDGCDRGAGNTFVVTVAMVEGASATFRATKRQAETVLHTFAGQVDLLDVALFQAFDGRGHAAVAPSPRAGLTSARTSVA